MKIIIKNTPEKNLIEIETSYEKISDLELIENFYLKVLSTSFLQQDIKLITIQPQKYSLGYELESKLHLKVNKIDVLVNEIRNCDIELIENINQSEDFKRGLLIITKNENFSEELISEVLNYQSNSINNITKGLAIFCENDGNSIVLFNSRLSIEQLKHLKDIVIHESEP